MQVEYAINDGGRPWHHAHPRFYERLLRRLLALPSRPLVLGLMMHSFHRHQASMSICVACTMLSVALAIVALCGCYRATDHLLCNPRMALHSMHGGASLNAVGRP